MKLALLGRAQRNVWIPALFAAAWTLCALPPPAPAQGPIRVETKQVLVPVFVLDKEQIRLLKNHPDDVIGAALAGYGQRAQALVEAISVQGLSARDFQVFDDDRQQTIRSVTYEPSLFWDLRDNIGHHSEFIGPGGGKWTTADWPAGMVGESQPQHYLVAYSLPESPEGSCHRIKIRVDRPNTIVEARSEYCNTKHDVSDPINGTRLGKQIENYLVAPKDRKVDVSLHAIVLYSRDYTARVHIALDWPWQSLKSKSRKNSVLGLVFGQNGTLATRFSDLGELRGGTDEYELPSPVETRYETQINVPPGNYDVRVAVGDGTRFGWAEIPLTVNLPNPRELAISAVSLCKQVSDVSASPSKLTGAWAAKLTNYVPLISNDFEFKPTGNTKFKARETLYTYFEVYEPLLGEPTPATVEIQLRIVDLKTGETKSDSQPISATPYVKPGNIVIRIGRGIDIRKLPKGAYRLDVRVTDSAQQNTPWSSVTFTVE